MATVLSISSQVVRGHVGNSAAVFVLQRLGHEVLQLPTVLLSNHPGHRHCAGEHISPDLLRRMLVALDDNGWLSTVDAIATGYLPSVEHVRVACAALALIRGHNASARYFCDPVIGDDPNGLYIEAAAAGALRDELLSKADVAFPNRFELSWLTGEPVDSPDQAMRAAKKTGAVTVVATSVPGDAAVLGTMLVTSDNAQLAQVAKMTSVPHGTGDMLAALFMAHTLAGATKHHALQHAVGSVQAAIAASQGHDELNLARFQDRWLNAAPVRTTAFGNGR